MITVTQNAIDYLSECIANENALGVRIYVASGGCKGMTYAIDFVKELNPADVVVDGYPVKLYVASKAVIFLSGMTMDYVKTPMGSSVVFENPNAKSKCGCGKSFCSYDDDVSDKTCGSCESSCGTR